MEPQPRPPPAVVGEEATLLIRHLPESIPLDTLSRLFSHYGASTVRPCSHSRVRNCAFVDFKNHASASRAQQHLNGLRFLGKVLSVQPAIKQVGKRKSQDKESGIGNDSTSFTKLTDDEKSRVGSYIAREPIAERLGVDYPFPPHLEYAYPLPDGNILTNIVNALIAVPRFYTQVLHLMNKMNIPAPFRAPLPTPPLPTSVPDPPPVPPPPVPPPPLVTNAGDSSDESEMESSDELPYLLPSQSLSLRPRDHLILPEWISQCGVGVSPVASKKLIDNGLISSTTADKSLPSHFKISNESCQSY